MHNDNWDDLRFVLAVAETGTVSGAAKRLGVNHATVLRRVAAFETRHGVEVFDRTSKGYAVRADRLLMIEAARDVSSAVRSVSDLLKGNQTPPRGTVRVSSTDTFCMSVLPEIIADLHADVNALTFALISTNAYSDFSRSHADVAVRPAARLSDGMTGDLAGELGIGVYATTEGDSDRWLGLTGQLLRSIASDWMAENVDPDRIVATSDSFVVQARLARQGLGRAVLPCCIGDGDPQLVRLDSHGDLPPVPIWVACHEDMAGVSRISAARRLLRDGLLARADRLRGVPT